MDCNHKPQPQLCNHSATTVQPQPQPQLQPHVQPQCNHSATTATTACNHKPVWLQKSLQPQRFCGCGGVATTFLQPQCNHNRMQPQLVPAGTSWYPVGTSCYPAGISWHPAGIQLVPVLALSRPNLCVCYENHSVHCVCRHSFSRLRHCAPSAGHFAFPDGFIFQCS